MTPEDRQHLIRWYTDRFTGARTKIEQEVKIVQELHRDVRSVTDRDCTYVTRQYLSSFVRKTRATIHEMEGHLTELKELL